MLDVICAGQAVVDCITRGREEEPYRPHVYRAQSIRLRLGGDAVNEAIALSALGRKAGVVCAVGDDPAGLLLKQGLEQAGVDTSRITTAVKETPIAGIHVNADGSRYSVNAPATRLTGYQIAPEALSRARIVSLASLFRPPLEDPEQGKMLIRGAKAQGSILCADTKLPLREGVTLDALSEVLPLVDYLFPNEGEAAYYTGAGDLPAMARVLRRYGVKNVIIKAGALGCYVSGDGVETMLPAVPVSQVVDTTGAGDTFVAGFLNVLLDGGNLLDCAHAGLTQAAKKISGQ